MNWSAENGLKLNVQIKPVEPTLEAGAQIQQMLTAECIDDFAGMLESFESLLQTLQMSEISLSSIRCSIAGYII